MSRYSSPTSDIDQVNHHFQLPPPSTTYIISDARSTPWSAAAAEAAALRRERLQSTSLSSLPSPTQMYEIPERIHVSQGILIEGDRYLYTAQHPDVLHCLAYARSFLKLPVSVSPEILALTALEMFLHPFDPVHWLFWSNEKKAETTRLVERYTLCRFPTIHHPLVWSTPECMFRLHGLHGKQLAEVLRDKPWYSALADSSLKKDSPQAKGPTLRKRKAPLSTPDSPRSESEELDVDLEAPFPPKRARTTKAQARRKDMSETKPPLDVSLLNTTSPDPSLDFTAATHDFSVPETSLLFETPSDSTETQQDSKQSGDPGVAVNRRSSGRLSRKTPKALAAARGRPSASRASSSSSVSTSVSLSSTPESAATQLPDEAPFSRTRSSSRLSAETLVAEQELCKVDDNILSVPSDESGEGDQYVYTQFSSPAGFVSQPVEITPESLKASSDPTAEAEKKGRRTRSQRVTRQTATKTESTEAMAASAPTPSRGRKRTRGGR